MTSRVFHDEDVGSGSLDGERVAVLGYGIQGRAQALTFRDSGVDVVVGNREDAYRERAREDGFEAVSFGEAVRQATIAVVLLPDEIQPGIHAQELSPNLAPGKALVFAHGFSVHYGLLEPRSDVDLLLLAPRMPGQFLRQRYLEGFGVPAYVDVARDASGRGWNRVLGLARALGITRCGAIRASFAQETELDHFSEQFTYPLIFRALEIAFETLVEAGYPPELALMELHGSEELGLVFSAAAREGLFPMLSSHASPACQVAIAHCWESASGAEDEIRERVEETIGRIRSGRFASYLVREAERSYPDLKKWKSERSAELAEAEKRLRAMLRGKA